MVEQKAKPVSKKVAAPKAKPSTGTAVAGKKRTAATEPVTTARKKTVVKKTVAAVVETKKNKPTVVKKVAAAATELKSPAGKAATAKARTPATANKTAVQPTPEQRYRMVQTAAYFIAEQHGFQGRSDEHWAAAEREIAAKLGQ